MSEANQDVTLVELTELGEQLGGLRLREPECVRAMEQSLRRHEQMTAVATFRDTSGSLQVLDGFKRLYAARELGWRTLLVRVHAVSGAQAKVAVFTLNRQRGLTELEEAWLVRSLYREEGLSQPEIGGLLGRHKSWVSRRLMLVERLDESVQADIRLGLVAPRTAVALAQLPRGNQRPAARVVTRCGLTTKQAEVLCVSLLAADGEEAQAEVLEGWEEGRRSAAGLARSKHPEQSPAQLLVLDVAQICRVSARLEARLLAKPRVALSFEQGATIQGALAGLQPVLELLRLAVSRACPADS